MKKYLIAILLVLLVATASYAWMSVMMAGGGISCSSSPTVSIDGAEDSYNGNIKHTTAYFYNGGLFTPSSDRSVCQVDFEIEEQSGDITNPLKTYHAEIWTVDGNDDFVAQQGSDSAGVGGQDGLNWYQFTFSPSVSLTNGTQYAVVVTTDAAVDASDVARLHRNDDSGSGGATYSTIFWGRWDENDDLGTSDTDYDPSIKIYVDS